MKTIKFKKERYIGDPMNAVRIFNDREADELVFLDIDATKKGTPPSLDLIRQIGEECNMPFAVGGGLKSIADIKEVFSNGAEKVVIGTQAMINPQLVREAADIFGSQSIVVCIDVKKTLLRGYEVVYKNATVRSGFKPLDAALKMQEFGAGEIMLSSVDRDGTMSGYDVDLVRSVCSKLEIPVIASGGAGSFEHMREVVTMGEASAAGAGSLFVYYGSRDSVLVNYPPQKVLKELALDY